MKQKTITQTGIIVHGTAYISLWGGETGEMEMNPMFLKNGEISPKRILGCVNDGGFRCESIKSAEIDIYTKYNNGNIEFDRTIVVDHPIHTQFFGKRGI